MKILRAVCVPWAPGVLDDECNVYSHSLAYKLLYQNNARCASRVLNACARVSFVGERRLFIDCVLGRKLSVT